MAEHKPKCKNDQKHTVLLNYEYDAYYCKDCNIWLENKCSDFECWACKNRPAVPQSKFKESE